MMSDFLPYWYAQHIMDTPSALDPQVGEHYRFTPQTSLERVELAAGRVLITDITTTDEYGNDQKRSRGLLYRVINTDNGKIAHAFIWELTQL